MGASKSKAEEPVIVKPPDEEVLTKGRASLKPSVTKETCKIATEKPCAAQLAGSIKRLSSTTTTEKSVLPTPACIKAEGDAKENAEAALDKQRKSLKGTETTVKQVLPTADCIKKEQEAPDTAAKILQDAKGTLKPTETKESPPAITAEIPEKPAPAELNTKRKSLKSVETTEKNSLPSATDIKEEGAVVEAGKELLDKARKSLTKVETVVKQPTPTVDDIAMEKAATEKASEVLEKRKSTLKPVETVEKNALPTANCIKVEKKDKTAEVICKVGVSESMARAKSEKRMDAEKSEPNKV